MPRDNAYGDDVSETEENELKKLMESNEVPEEDDKQLGAPGGDDDAPPPPKPNEDDDDDAPPPPPAPKPGEGDDEQPGQTDDEKLAAFLEKHKGKSPEEIARIAFQQQQRATKAEFDGRKVSQQLGQTLERIQAARAKATTDAEARRAAFAEKLAKDPDAALLEARTEQLSQEERAELDRLEREEFDARANAAVQFASSVIPDFDKRAPIIRQFATELGFTAEEVGGIVDGRQIVTLHLANIAGNMIKAGLMDTSGRFLKLPQPVVDPDAGGQQQQQRGSGFGKQPARGAGVQKSLEQQLGEIAAMSDADLEKMDPAVLEGLLRAAEAE